MAEMSDEEFDRMLARLPSREETLPPQREPLAASGMQGGRFSAPQIKASGFIEKAQDFASNIRERKYGKPDTSPRERRQQQLLQGTIMDAEAIQKAIQGEDMPKAVDVLVDRMNVLEKLGEDTSDTKMLRDALVSGRPDIVMREIDTFINSAKRQGLIKPPAPIEDKYVTSDDSGRVGTMVMGTDGVPVFRPATGAQQKPEDIDYGTYTENGIEMYSQGPYVGLSLGKVSEMLRTGQLGKFGDPLTRAPARTTNPRESIRPPMQTTSPVPESDLSTLSSQEAMIRQQELNQERILRKREEAEEARKVTQETERLSPVQEESYKSNLKRLNDLSELRVNRITGMETAQQFLDAFKSGEKSSGAGRTALSFLPIGTYTEQGQFDEALDSFAEFAAREKLKASGEIKPTDADVKGAKQALFGIGRDEAVNINLLETFIRQQQAAENEYANLIDSKTKGTLQDYIPSVEIPTGGTPSFMQPEGELDKAINRLNALGVQG
tara:strand:+ start:4045 stop:5529 length:1485 start_codon:yes stop_codon:yes gene_type:complete